MSRSNGSIIGSRNTPTAGSARGVWDLAAQRQAIEVDAWPIVSALPVSAAVAVWLDSTDAATLFDATSDGSAVAYDGTIARWENKVPGRGHFTQVTSGDRPVRKEAAANGLDAILFDNDFMTFAGTLTLTAGFSIYLVQKRVSNNGGAIIGWGSGSASHMPYADGLWYMGFGRTNRPGWAGGYTTDVMAVSVVAAPGDWTAYLDGVEKYTDAATLANNASFNFIGKDVNFANAYLCEFIIYEATHDDTERGLVEAYLMTKWGI